MMINSSDKKKLEAKWIKMVTVFLYVTVIWNIIEGSVSVYTGYIGNDISLFAFGIDSWIEVLSASLVLYHMIFSALPRMKKQIIISSSTPLKSGSNASKSVLFTLETERKLTLFIGCLLVIFCLFACVGGIFRLIEGVPPSSTKWGIIIGGICVIAMFIMWYYKTKAAVILNSSTIASDAACSLGCIKLSTVLLIGSILYEIWHQLWWVDAVTAIIIGLLVGYEGYETIKGAKDKEKFKGGCGCCGASDSGLAKYFRTKFEKEMNQEITNKNNEDNCCDGNDDDDDDDDDCCNVNVDTDDCCGGGITTGGDNDDNCCGSKVKSYGAINNTKKNEKNNNISSGGCGGDDCCGGK